jgi:AcrR family transcriptional regulator
VRVRRGVKSLAPSHAPSRATKTRLTDALATLTATPRSSDRPTVTSLCRLACVSRNTLYRYYPSMADSIRRLRRRRGGQRGAAQQYTLRALRYDLATLRDQVAKLATLADHYHALTEELRGQLARRDRELGELRRHTRPTPLRLHR